MRVKICGITNLQDALDAVEAGADALGFVFYEKSPRFITPEKAAEIAAAMPPFVERVGLFVNVPASEVNAVCRQAKMGLAQIHFDAPDRFYDALEVKHLKVVRAKKAEDLRLHEEEYRIVDAFVEGYGGEGKRIDPTWFTGVDCSKIILAGGLNSENLYEIVDLPFYALDLSSGVEKKKGKKDKMKMQNFIKAVKNGKI
ncbi:MAG: phosphoribosylanthranilate isomerase [Sulfurospirillum sp.]|nr:MAG: phosphoribosylanthranilate isomerase [Sulfurospirillum sp.]